MLRTIFTLAALLFSSDLMALSFFHFRVEERPWNNSGARIEYDPGFGFLMEAALMSSQGRPRRFEFRTALKTLEVSFDTKTRRLTLTGKVPSDVSSQTRSIKVILELPDYETRQNHFWPPETIQGTLQFFNHGQRSSRILKGTAEIRNADWSTILGMQDWVKDGCRTAIERVFGKT